ncbi:MAG: sulfatase [Candidatus Latescibacteria bacterium]|jgi:arylsulfatase A-like enzyme|nr:sulfatase [Candidatus Latescibacterota bacterium]
MNRPNIVFILIDDMGWRDLSCCGSEFYETPNIDMLASQGMRFTDAYAACPVCSPTRASILTGKYPATVGVTDWIDWGGRIHPARGRVIDVPYLKALPTSEHSLARALQDGGYATWHVGKWHLGGEGSLPQDHGFDVNIGGCHWGSPGRGGYFSPWSIPELEDADTPEGTCLTDHLTDRAIDLIRERDERPFYLNLWYYAVHTPIQANQEKIRKYEAKVRELGLDRVKTFEEGEAFPCEHKKDQRILRRLVQSDPVYAAMIENLDENIGRLLRAIEEYDEADNTIVVFTSDNGGLATSEGSPTCNAPLAEGKGWMYEGGTREPLFIKWPGRVQPGSICHVPVTSTDFYPTLLEAAGLDMIPEQHADGVSLVPLLQGGDALERDAIFWHYPHYANQGGTPGSSVRMGDHKLIEFYEDGRIELYDLAHDPGEHRDLSRVLPETADRLAAVLREWREKVEAKIPQPNPDWDS